MPENSIQIMNSIAFLLTRHAPDWEHFVDDQKLDGVANRVTSHR
jgi:hypothetical protein